MTDERALLAEVAAHPTERTIQFALADWYLERDRGAEHLAWKWIATFRRHPVTFRGYMVGEAGETKVHCQPCAPLRDDEECLGWGWVNWSFDERESGTQWPWSAGHPTLPKELFRWLPKTDNEYHDGNNSHRPYNSVAEAFGALVKAFISATRPRTNRLDRLWNGKQLKPNWDLAAYLPQED